MNEVINIEEKLNLFSDLWSPKRIEKLNGQQVIPAKVKGEFVFYKHTDQDYLFMVIKGQLTIKHKDKTVVINSCEFYTDERGVEPIDRNLCLHALWKLISVELHFLFSIDLIG